MRLLFAFPPESAWSRCLVFWRWLRNAAARRTVFKCQRTGRAWSILGVCGFSRLLGRWAVVRASAYAGGRVSGLAADRWWALILAYRARTGTGVAGPGPHLRKIATNRTIHFYGRPSENTSITLGAGSPGSCFGGAGCKWGPWCRRRWLSSMATKELTRWPWINHPLVAGLVHPSIVRPGVSSRYA